MAKPKFKTGDWVRAKLQADGHAQLEVVGIVIDVFEHEKLNAVYHVRTSPDLTAYIHEEGLEHVHKKVPRTLAGFAHSGVDPAP